MQRRGLLKGVAVLAALGPSSGISKEVGSQDFGWPVTPLDRLEQGPFDTDQDEGWLTALFTTPSDKPLRNTGLGLVGSVAEEGGPSLSARAGRATLENYYENITS